MPQNRQGLHHGEAKGFYDISQEIRLFESEINTAIGLQKISPRSKAIPKYISFLERCIENLRSADVELHAYVDSIEDERVRQVVKLRAVDGLTVEQVAEIMHYSDRMVKRLWACRPKKDEI